MPRRRGKMRLLAAALLLTCGCWTTEPNLRPPSHPEELMPTPADDSRFSSPPTYPKESSPYGKPKKDKPGDPSKFSTGMGGNGFR